jgi:hypothetical protein
MEVSFATLQGSGGKVLLAGNLNARTGTLSDIQDPADDEDDGHWPYYPPLLLPTCKPPQRANKDGVINSCGRKLVQVCQETGMYILNGRTAGDGDGHLTCQGSSTVDYFLASSNCLNQATSLHVLSSIPDSDHSPVCLSWVMDDQTSEENLPDEHTQPIKKARPCQPLIKNPINIQQIEDYHIALQAMLDPSIMSDNASMPLATHLQNATAQSASMTFGVRKPRTLEGFPVNPWVDDEGTRGCRCPSTWGAPILMVWVLGCFFHFIHPLKQTWASPPLPLGLRPSALSARPLLLRAPPFSVAPRPLGPAFLPRGFLKCSS